MSKKITSRRQFIKKGSITTLASLFGINIVFANHIPDNYLPLILQSDDPYKLFGKHKDMSLLNDRPWNMEAKAHLLDDLVTPATNMFIRNNGKIPEVIDIDNWKLNIDGESVETPKSYALSDIKTKFKHYTYQLTLECGGNGRNEFSPPAKGNQWTIGAVSSAKWTGIRLSDLLKDVGVKSDAVYIGYYGGDIHLTGNPDKVVISRGIPLSKAMQAETLVAFQMNGEDIPLAHGYPLRLVVGGWPASTSGKWLNRLSIRDQIHDGPKMGGQSYRVPCESIAPGTKVEDENMCIIESMPVKSLITYPKSGAVIKKDKQLEFRGHAWAGELVVKKVDYSIDFGVTWQSCTLKPAENRLAWQHWSGSVIPPEAGYYEIWVRATDSNNQSQPMIVPGWNPKGYLNNACHRIAIKVV